MFLTKNLYKCCKSTLQFSQIRKNVFELSSIQCNRSSIHLLNQIKKFSGQSADQPANLPPHNSGDKYADDDKSPERIYYGSLTAKMKAVKVFSLTTSLTGLAVQPLLIEQGAKIGGTAMVVFLCGFAGIFTFVTPLLLHFITKKYVTEMHYDSANKEYIATTISLFLRRKETRFKVSDVSIPEVAGMFTTFKVDKTSLFVDASMFTDPNHYVKIMGYDKPMDFKLELTESDTLKQNKR